MNDIIDYCFLDAKEEVSAVVCSKNRTDNLLISLDSWLDIKEISEIIILDFGSDIPISVPVNEPRIKLYRYESEYWHLAKAYNIAIQLASKPIIIKLDSDYYLDKDFFKYHKINNKIFYAGRGGPLTGCVMMHKFNFLMINGYNERIINYGADDGDLYNRLSKNLNLVRYKINYDLIKHLDHTERERYEYQPSNIKRSHSRSNYWIAKTYPWTIEDKMSNFYDE